jgi:hypothetical protein
MPAWITLTTDKLRDTKASALIDAYQGAALGEDQTDPVPRKIATVCDRIRAEIQASGKYQVSATPHSIPPSLEDLVARLITWDLRGRLNATAGSSLEPTDQDKIDHRDDLAYLQRIAAGEVPIEVPLDPESSPEVQSGAPKVEAIGCRPRQNTRDTMRNL